MIELDPFIIIVPELLNEKLHTHNGFLLETNQFKDSFIWMKCLMNRSILK